MGKYFFSGILLVGYAATVIGMENNTVRSLYIKTDNTYALVREKIGSGALVTTASNKFVQVEDKEFLDGVSGRGALIDENKISSDCKSLSIHCFQPSDGVLTKADSFKCFSISAFQNSDGMFKKNNDTIKIGNVIYVLKNVEEVFDKISVRCNPVSRSKIVISVSNDMVKKGLFVAAIPTLMFFGLIGCNNAKNIRNFIKSIQDSPLLEFVQDHLVFYFYRKLFRL